MRAALAPEGDSRVGRRWIESYAALWIGLACLTILIVAMPGLPVASRGPELAAVVATLAISVSLVLLHLGVVRFRVLGNLMDLYAGLAFGVLGLTDVTRLGELLVEPRFVDQQGGMVFSLVARMVAAILLVAGLASSRTVIERTARSARARRASVSVALVLLAVAVVALGSNAALPRLLDEDARAFLNSQPTVDSVLPGQAAALVLANAAITALFTIAAVGLARVSRRLRDTQFSWLATALAVLSFAEVFTLFFPPAAVQFVSTGDLYRLTAYGILLYSVVSRLGGEIAERAAQAERMRLSSELHDGLAQQLGLLHLRASGAAGLACSEPRHTQDLDTVQRQLEAALVEARQAITTLRTGKLSWEELSGALSSFIDEFSENHEVDGHFVVRGPGSTVDAGLQTEFLRILHESFSNAVRHGKASRLDVMLDGGSIGGVELLIQDDGCGFEPSSAVSRVGARGERCVGLDSMRERVERRGGLLKLRSSPQNGALVRVRLPYGTVAE